MADAAVEFLLGNLKDLLLYHSDLITETKSQVEELEKDLCIFRAFLKDSVKKRRKSKGIQSLVRDVVYEVEEIIDAIVTQSTYDRSRSYFPGAFKSTISFHGIGKQVESVRERVVPEFALLNGHEKPEVQPDGFKDVVAAVEHLLSNLNDLLVHRTQLIINVKSQIKELEKDMRIIYAFLKDSVEKWTKSEGKHSLVHTIRDVVYEVEYVIHVIFTRATQIRSQNQFVRDFKSQLSFHEIVRLVEEVRKKVKKGRSEFVLVTDTDEKIYEVRPPRLKDVIGFEDVSTELIQWLTTETDYFDVISLIGMFGLGKTTLAWKIYNDPRILYEFPICIWLSISQQFSEKDIFIAILEKFVTINDNLRAKEEQHLSQMVAAHLDNGKFLIVMDDVWSANDWDRISTALPANNKMGKVLITSREVDLGKYASRPRDPTTLRFFNQNESWELLRLEALGHLDCPSDLQNVGKIIANDCMGLPLAIVVIGGILATKYSSSDVGAMRRVWEKVSTRVGIHLKEDPRDRMNTFISLSYDKLPYHLQACFLYLGMFPEDYEIPVSKLIRMWIGEGFIQHVKRYSLEETAESYLEDLINRNLVRIDKMKPNGKIKTCRIHDALRDFCRNKGGREKENFLEEIKCNDGLFEPPISDIKNYRRLAIHSKCLNFLCSKPFGRSFVCINNDEFVLPEDNTSAIPAAFKLLRVLDVKPIIFTKIPSDMYHLIHLRFIVLSFKLKILSPKFNMLWNIQTLIVHTTSHTLEVKADISKMKQLRHFKTNACATLLQTGNESKHGAELQTLGTISAESCTAELLHRAPNLLKLGIRGRLGSLFEGKIGSFNSLGKMRKLKKLELINDVYPNPASEGPQQYQFPSTLRSLTLCSTHFTWSYMSTLGLLENLEALKLKDKAFVGRTWVGIGGHFHRLEFLHIDHTDLHVWQASSHHFPRLKGLVLRNCEHLLEIPSELAEIPSFQKLELHICRSAAASAKSIKEKKKEKMAVFNLSIFPAIDDLP